MFESPVKQSLKSVARGRQTTGSYSVYIVLLVLTRGRDVSLSKRRIGWISRLFPTPSHLVPLFGVTPVEFMEKALRFLKLVSSRQPVVKIL